MGCGASKETPSTSNVKKFSQKTKENEEEKDRKVVKYTSDVEKVEKSFEGKIGALDGMEKIAKNDYNEDTKFTGKSSKKGIEDNKYTGTEESSNKNIENEDNKLGTEDEIETNNEVIDKTNKPKADKNVLENNKKPQEDGASETGYYKNVTGIMERTINCRRHFKDDEPAKRPKASSDDLFIDTSFLLNLPSGVKYQNMKWKRPKVFHSF